MNHSWSFGFTDRFSTRSDLLASACHPRTSEHNFGFSVKKKKKVPRSASLLEEFLEQQMQCDSRWRCFSSKRKSHQAQDTDAHSGPQAARAHPFSLDFCCTCTLCLGVHPRVGLFGLVHAEWQAPPPPHCPRPNQRNSLCNSLYNKHPKLITGGKSGESAEGHSVLCRQRGYNIWIKHQNCLLLCDWSIAGYSLQLGWPWRGGGEDIGPHLCSIPCPHPRPLYHQGHWRRLCMSCM